MILLIPSNIDVFALGGQYAGGGQSSSVNDFMTFDRPTSRSVDSPGASGYVFKIYFHPNVLCETLELKVNRIITTPPTCNNDGTEVSFTINNLNTSGRNSIVFSIDGVKPNGQTATDTDRFVIVTK